MNLIIDKTILLCQNEIFGQIIETEMFRGPKMFVTNIDLQVFGFKKDLLFRGGDILGIRKGGVCSLKSPQP